MLKKMLKSIPNIENIEILVIDDNSEETKKLEKIKEDYNHVRFFKNDKGIKGAGSCRNIGLKHAKGKWVLFGDADDFFLENFYLYIEKYFNAKYDVIFFSPTSLDLETQLPSDRHIEYEKVMLNYLRDKKNIKKNKIFLRYAIGVPWSKLLKRDFLIKNNILFEEILVSNDIVFSRKVGHNMKNFKVSKEKIYCVTKSKGSLTTAINIENFETRVKVFIEHYNYLKNELSINDFKLLSLNGREYLIKSLKAKFGLKSTLLLYIYLRKNNIKVFDRKFLNPFFTIRKTYQQLYKK